LPPSWASHSTIIRGFLITSRATDFHFGQKLNWQRHWPRRGRLLFIEIVPSRGIWFHNDVHTMVQDLGNPAAVSEQIIEVLEPPRLFGDHSKTILGQTIQLLEWGSRRARDT